MKTTHEQACEQARRAAIIALQNKPSRYDHTIVIGDYELAIAIDAYAVIPPSGRCRQMCETPEEFYGETILEYRVVRIWGLAAPPGQLFTGHCIPGHDMNLPKEVSRSALDSAVLDWCEHER